MQNPAWREPAGFLFLEAGMVFEIALFQWSIQIDAARSILINSPVSSRTTTLAALLACLLAVGLVSVEITSTYRFYQVNAYKLFIAMVWISLLAPFVMIAAFRRTLPVPPLLLLVLWFIPLVVNLPGAWLTQGRWQYGMGESLAQGCTVAAWAWLAWALARLGYASRLLDVMFYTGGLTAMMALAETRSLAPLSPGLFRASASFGNPGYLAGWFLLVLPLGFARLLQWPQAMQEGRYFGVRKVPAVWARWCLDALLTLAIIAAIMAGKTRIAQLLLLVWLLAVSIWLVKRYWSAIASQKRLRWVMIMAGGLILVLLWHSPVWERFPELFDNSFVAAQHSALSFATGYSQIEGRLVPWRAALVAMQEATWFGHGPGSYYSAFFSHVDPESRAFWVERSYFDAHNILLNAAVEGGLLGVLASFGVWAVWCICLWRIQRDASLPEVQRDYILAVGTGILLMLAFSMTAVSYRMMVLMLPAQLLLAIAVGAAPEKCKTMQQGRITSTWLVWFVLIIFAWMLGGPSLASKNQFMEIQRIPSEEERYEGLKFLVAKNPNVYATDRLLQMALARRDWTTFFFAAKSLEKEIPNYRQTRYFIARAFFARGDMRNARKAALDYQKRDRYFGPNNRLLMSIAAVQGDMRLLHRQIEIALLFAFKFSKGVERDVKEIELKGSDVFSCHTSGPRLQRRLVLTLPDIVISEVFKAALNAGYEGEPVPEDERKRRLTVAMESLLPYCPSDIDKEAFLHGWLIQVL